MADVPGFYGKFPELGDFVNRRLPQEFIDNWDEWLQQSISSSREQLGENWLNAYLTSPIWRFAVDRGLLGDFPWCGLLMPSVDRVGRYFPLTLACRLPLDASLFSVFYNGGAWFDAAEQVILKALEEGLEMNDFDNQVVSLGNLEHVAMPFSHQPDKGFGQAWRMPLADSDCKPGLSGLAQNLIVQRLGTHSAWWSSGSENVAPSLLFCSELPRPRDFAAMLLGNWNSSNWEQWGGEADSLGVEGIDSQ